MAKELHKVESDLHFSGPLTGHYLSLECVVNFVELALSTSATLTLPVRVDERGQLVLEWEV